MSNTSLTTKADRWRESHPPESVKWTKAQLDSEGFDHEFEESYEPFNFIKELGSGGHGSVAEGKSKETGVIVVVKRFDVEPSRADNTFAALRKEVDVMRKLSHHHITRFVGSYTTGLRFRILTVPAAICNLELVLCNFQKSETQKSDLERAIGKPHWPIQRFLPSCMGCLAHALQYMHNMAIPHVRHKDIKPANILFNGNIVQFCDFGISKTFTTEQSGSTGYSPKTIRYAPSEVLEDDKHQGRPQDIFSLALVFLEIFAIYKGSPIQEIRDLAKEKYADNIPGLLDWVWNHCVERCDIQLYELLRRMLDHVPDNRPTATQVWESIVTFATQDRVYFCGSCCMPLVLATRTEEQDKEESPYPLDYRREAGTNKRYGKDADFEVKFMKGERPNFRWVRCLRLTKMSISDEVYDDTPTTLCRKRIFPPPDSNNDADEACEAWESAKNEARIVRKFKHAHILKLDGTYQHDNCYALLLTPAATFELQYFLRLASIEPEKRTMSPGDVSTTLREAFGCLASAVMHVHENQLVHGDISSSSIFIKDGLVYLGHFGQMVLEQRRKKMQGTHYHMEDDDDKYVRKNRYAPQENTVAPAHLHTPADDIYSLGCVYLEMQTVRQGRTVMEMEKFLYSGPWKNIESKLNDWTKELERGDCLVLPSNKFWQCLRMMLAAEKHLRPTAQHVHEVMNECKTAGNDLFYCTFCSSSQRRP